VSGETKAPVSPPAISSFRLVATMGGAGAVAGLLIILVYQFTLATVLANRNARLEGAILQVVPGSARYEPLYLIDGALTPTLPTGVLAKDVPKLYSAADAGGTFKGYAIPASEPGFADSVEIIVGFDPARPGTLGLAVLASRETPGLGNKIEGQSWLEQFTDANTPLVGVKAGMAQRPEDVAMITGATISSRTVINAINKAVARWTPVLAAYRAGGKS
jgi:Na+-translocating ferredoxin:NAD+ oxidoreductase subunit G